MRIIFYLIMLFLSMVQVSMNCQQQADRGAASFPADFRIEALAGGLHPWEENRYVLITAEGHGKFERSIPGKIGAPPVEEIAFTLQRTDLVELWKAIVENDFFSLAPEYKNENVTGGWFASLTITAAGKTQQVTVENFDLPGFAHIIRKLNNFTPTDKDLIIDGGEL
ncbi:MAG: hypothetical protein ACREOO_24915 [bacterium]